MFVTPGAVMRESSKAKLWVVATLSKYPRSQDNQGIVAPVPSCHLELSLSASARSKNISLSILGRNPELLKPFF